MAEFDTAVGGPHDGAGVVTRGPSLEDATGVLLALHGRRGTPHGMLSTIQSIETDGLAVLAPGAVGHDWLTEPVTAPVAAHEPALGSGLRVVGRLVDRAVSAVGRERVGLFGFSQGGSLAAEWAARNPDRYGGVVTVAGPLLDGSDRSFDGSLAPGGDPTPVVVGGSESDPHVPADRVRTTARTLQTLGGSVETILADNAGHGITQTQLAATRGVVRTLAD